MTDNMTSYAAYISITFAAYLGIAVLNTYADPHIFHFDSTTENGAQYLVEWHEVRSFYHCKKHLYFIFFSADTVDLDDSIAHFEIVARVLLYSVMIAANVEPCRTV